MMTRRLQTPSEGNPHGALQVSRAQRRADAVEVVPQAQKGERRLYVDSGHLALHARLVRREDLSPDVQGVNISAGRAPQSYVILRTVRAKR
jgi:hypothetical protein